MRLLWRSLSSSSVVYLSASSSSSSRPSRYVNTVRGVSIAPVEQAPAPEFDVWEEISRLEGVRSRLRVSRNLREKLRVLDADPRVNEFFGGRGKGILKLLSRLDSSQIFLLKCLVAAGQGHVLVSDMDVEGEPVTTQGSALKSAFYVLADMIENWNSDWNGADGGKCGIGTEALNGLLLALEEIEKFYNCIGGIIG